MAYYHDVLGNLRALRIVARLHPRLALLGVASEIELVFRELFPTEVVKRWTEDYEQMHWGHPYPETAAIRFQVGEEGRRDVLPAKTRALLSSILERGNSARHTRSAVTVDQAEELVEDSIEFLSKLLHIQSRHVLTCRCHGQMTFHYSAALNASAGTVTKLKCPRCKAIVGTLHTPNVRESYRAFARATDTLEDCQTTATLLLAEAIEVLIVSDMDDLLKSALQLLDAVQQWKGPSN